MTEECLICKAPLQYLTEDAPLVLSGIIAPRADEVKAVAEKYGYEPIRFLMISSHYRGPINYNTEVLEQNRNALDRNLFN